MNIWRHRGILWPAVLLARAVLCAIKKIPRGLIVEPSQGCTGNCVGCDIPEKPALLEPKQLEAWLKASPAKPVTIHFSGKHSDPLASPLIKNLADTALKNCSMLSISTIGLGLKPTLEQLPVDRWIFSIPAATCESWEALRGSNRLDEVLNAISTVQKKGRAMVEVVLTIWKSSTNDIEPFNQLAQKENWQHTKVVSGRFDPTGHHVGIIENLALDNPECPYTLSKNNSLTLKRSPQGCPLAGYLFLDATGTLRPCPFTSNEAPHLVNPDLEAWLTAKEWAEQKQSRSYSACRWCP